MDWLCLYHRIVIDLNGLKAPCLDLGRKSRSGAKLLAKIMLRRTILKKNQPVLREKPFL